MPLVSLFPYTLLLALLNLDVSFLVTFLAYSSVYLPNDQKRLGSYYSSLLIVFSVIIGMAMISILGLAWIAKFSHLYVIFGIDCIFCLSIAKKGDFL
ncbi:MAG TPA: hypothetical protein VJ044_08785 [Candidatus Hodarchaeales archaeon]|nr:hypothetical protein [Candidatus Hodarchaeales archaeon]